MHQKSSIKKVASNNIEAIRIVQICVINLTETTSKISREENDTCTGSGPTTHTINNTKALLVARTDLRFILVFDSKMDFQMRGKLSTMT